MSSSPAPSQPPSPPGRPMPVPEPGIDHRHRSSFWIGLAIGGSLIVYGVRGVLIELGPGNPVRLAGWVVALDLVHDLLFAPIVVVLGLLLARVLPATMRGPARAAVALSGVVVLFSIPLLTGWGRRAGNSSTLPLDYARNLAIILAVIWVVAALTAAVRMLRR